MAHSVNMAAASPLMPIRLAFEDASLLSRLSRSDGSLFRSRSIALDEVGTQLATTAADETLKLLATHLTGAKPGGLPGLGGPSAGGLPGLPGSKKK